MATLSLCLVFMLSLMLVHQGYAFALLAGNNNSTSELAPQNSNAGVRRGEAVILAIPAADRQAFIMYQLARALNETQTNASEPTQISGQQRTQSRFNYNDWLTTEQITVFESFSVYDDFAVDLLHWLQWQYEIVDFNIFNGARTSPKLCSSKGVCYSPAEISGYCCPF